MLQVEHCAILSNFIKLSFVIKFSVLSIVQWPFYTCFCSVLELSYLLLFTTRPLFILNIVIVVLEFIKIHVFLVNQC